MVKFTYKFGTFTDSFVGAQWPDFIHFLYGNKCFKPRNSTLRMPLDNNHTICSISIVSPFPFIYYISKFRENHLSQTSFCCWQSVLEKISFLISSLSIMESWCSILLEWSFHSLFNCVKKSMFSFLLSKILMSIISLKFRRNGVNQFPPITHVLWHSNLIDTSD